MSEAFRKIHPDPSEASSGDVATYEELGYVLKKDVSAGFLADVREAFGRFNEIDQDDKVGRWWTAKDGSTKHRLNPHLRYAVFRRLIESEEVRTFARKIFGTTRAYITHSKISLKEPGKNHAWLPHQDSGYKEEPQFGFTTAVFLEDADASNGSLQVFPGSHKLGSLKHKKIFSEEDFAGQQTVAELPNIPPVTVEAKAGNVLFFSLDTIHQSQPNLKSGKRLIFIFEMQRLDRPHTDEHGRLPVVLNGSMTLMEKGLALAGYWGHPRRWFKPRQFLGHLKKRLLGR